MKQWPAPSYLGRSPRRFHSHAQERAWGSVVPWKSTAETCWNRQKSWDQLWKPLSMDKPPMNWCRIFSRVGNGLGTSTSKRKNMKKTPYCYSPLTSSANLSWRSGYLGAVTSAETSSTNARFGCSDQLLGMLTCRVNKNDDSLMANESAMSSMFSCDRAAPRLEIVESRTIHLCEQLLTWQPPEIMNLPSYSWIVQVWGRACQRLMPLSCQPFWFTNTPMHTNTPIIFHLPNKK